MNNTKTGRRLTSGIAVVIFLSICLVITTFALVYTGVKVENNYFSTGNVSINLNDGKAVIEADEFIFEPGVRVIKDFFIENTGSDSVYYKLYFKNVTGDLAEAIEVSFIHGDKVVASGLMSELDEETSIAADDLLLKGEKRDLKILFRFKETGSNNYQDNFLSFDLCAKAVQTKNNGLKLFD